MTDVRYGGALGVSGCGTCTHIAALTYGLESGRCTGNCSCTWHCLQQAHTPLAICPVLACMPLWGVGRAGKHAESLNQQVYNKAKDQHMLLQLWAAGPVWWAHVLAHQLWWHKNADFHNPFQGPRCPICAQPRVSSSAASPQPSKGIEGSAATHYPALGGTPP